MTAGERLYILLGNLRTQNGNVLTREQWVKAATDFITVELASAPGRAPRAKGAPKPSRPRNPLFDTLATCTGTKNLLAMTRPHLKAVGVALADIMAVTPDLTVEEIQHRAEAYKRRWPDPRNWSAPALAKHWGEFGGAPTRTGLPTMAEPTGDWRRAAATAAEETLDLSLRTSRLTAVQEKYGWHQLGPEFRAAILLVLNRTTHHA